MGKIINSLYLYENHNKYVRYVKEINALIADLMKKVLNLLFR